MYDKQLDKESIKDYLGKFKDLDLKSHYDFNDFSECLIGDVSELKRLIADNKPIKFSINDANELYYKLSDEKQEQVFDIDVEKSFSKSDVWLYDKLISVSKIFPNVASSKISDEMSSFYVCIVAASVFEGEFEEELLEVASEYDFTNWKQGNDTSLTFFDLCNEWIQLGSKYVKMVAAAAKFSIMRERRKKPIPSALQLPEDLDLELNKTIRDVEAIRFEYDYIKLSDYNKAQLTKLEIKTLIAKRDKEIEDRLTNNMIVYQVWRLLNLNSNNIPPNTLLKFNRMSRKEAGSVFMNIYNVKSLPTDQDGKIALKKVQMQLKKVSIRAYLNKLFSAEVEKLKSNPEKYVAPAFV